MNDSFQFSNLHLAMLAKIEELERIRRDFIANVSHELRTPLTVLKGYLETLLNQPEQDPLYLQKIFKQMYQHSLRMENLLEDLLQLARLESPNQSWQSQQVLVSEVLTSLCEDSRKISGVRQHQINLFADQKLCLLGNKRELKSLFSNVIINAVKYTPNRGQITVRWYFDESLQTAVFSVKDTGIGIAKKHIPRITERFYRVDRARSRDSGGTGLGLAIAKHVLLRHGGKLQIKSKPNQGSEFKFIFDPKLTAWKSN